VNRTGSMIRQGSMAGVLLAAALSQAFAASPATGPVLKLSVHLVTGLADLSPGSVVELRIYELGGGVRRLSLNHGEGWPADSTRDIALSLNAPLDPRNVVRYGIYYRSATAEPRTWEVIAADAYAVPTNHTEPVRLSDASLAGQIGGQGEIDTVERSVADLVCTTDADCDDHRSCNGHERCAPNTAGADLRGCVSGTPVSCPVNQICTEAHGCIGAAPAP